MASEHRRILSFFTFRRIIIPVILGLGVALFLFIRDFDQEQFEAMNWTIYSSVWLVVSLMLMLTRDIAYMWRIRILTGYSLSWRKAFQVIMLWEFASSVTPSVVGGSVVALFIVRKEGFSMGKTTSIVMVTALLDELFYIIMVPLVLLIAGTTNLFVSEGTFFFMSARMGMIGIFIIGYLFILTLTTIITLGVFINPQGFKRVLVKLTFIPFLKRWRSVAVRTGDEIISTSEEFRGKSFLFWLKAFGATFISWTARFWVVNVLIIAFTGEVYNQFIIYARQLVMWVILLISPTPGSSGTAEYFFPLFLGEFTSGFSDVVAVSWRMISYYPYLFIGVIVLPVWIRRVYFGRRRSIRFRKD